MDQSVTFVKVSTVTLLGSREGCFDPPGGNKGASFVEILDIPLGSREGSCMGNYINKMYNLDFSPIQC